MTMKMVDCGMVDCCCEEVFDAASAVTVAWELLESDWVEPRPEAGPISLPVSPEVVLGDVSTLSGEEAVGLVTCSATRSLVSFLLSKDAATCSICFLPFIHAEPISLAEEALARLAS